MATSEECSSPPPPPPLSSSSSAALMSEIHPLSKSVSWGIPSSEEISEDDRINDRQRLGPGFVRRSHSVKLIDRALPDHPLLLFDVKMWKMRRIRRNWIEVNCSLVITCEIDEDENKTYHISMTYRPLNAGNFSLKQKIDKEW